MDNFTYVIQRLFCLEPEFAHRVELLEENLTSDLLDLQRQMVELEEREIIVTARIKEGKDQTLARTLAKELIDLRKARSDVDLLHARVRGLISKMRIQETMSTMKRIITKVEKTDRMSGRERCELESGHLVDEMREDGQGTNAGEEEDEEIEGEEEDADEKPGRKSD